VTTTPEPVPFEVPDAPPLGAAEPAPISPAPINPVPVSPAPLSPAPAGELITVPEPTPRLPRVGVGTDVHAYADDRECWVAGLQWPGETGLAGHSDGDVAAHAACDALLSASGLGDLGSNYGTGRPEWAGASGKALLEETGRRVRAAGHLIGNVSIQLIGVSPRLGPRREEAEAALGVAIGAPVSISATTTDGLGFTGNGEGLAAVAVALILAS
jgi:2-C-methyl-D-erythritol 2,4-cyclodiphosphate synthase